MDWIEIITGVLSHKRNTILRYAYVFYKQFGILIDSHQFHVEDKSGIRWNPITYEGWTSTTLQELLWDHNHNQE